MRRALALVLAVVALLAGAGCTAEKETRRADGHLWILASSELRDMEPIVERVGADIGVDVRLFYMGTLEAADVLAKGEADQWYQAVWLSSNDSLRLRPEAARRVVSETPVMSSPVALGVRPAALRKLGGKPDDVTWARVAQAVRDDGLTYGMTDPGSSNSGFSALISVASALSGAQSALTDADVEKATPRLKEFFRGQKLTSGSSGWLASAYKRRGNVDALINYESVLKGIPGLTVIRPRDGVVTADYPLSTLASADAARRDDVRRLADALRTPKVQREITERTHRRPVVASVPPASGLDESRRRELPFPGSRSVADGLLDSYDNELRRPSQTVYVLDTSGSMEGDRLAQLKKALTHVSGRFRGREEVTLMPFGSQVKDVRRHAMGPDPRSGVADVRADIGTLTAEGDTAIYTSLEKAYDELRTDRDMFTSIVLMTDGENTAGSTAAQFEGFHALLDPAQREIPVFPILFGDSDRGELEHIAELTGGRLFDARQGSLDGAFEEIRGYQ
ncbi:Ca-activated chloride channel family protein [Streptomyces canus]|uniref:substrate-binding and vWA domain-containing protein n=1 Tax=Streptomyces canus TaxID=58343 RepID=UPI00277FE59E|nr:substrate-binding and VWA domain-containing protein [Streptomyces canus]MDQ0599280.1 Ca-activated chloride channel family protein [Streptomyces canus]